MVRLMLTLDRNVGFRRRVLASLALHPRIFDSLLAVHVGAESFADLLCWELFPFCRALLEV